MGALACVVFKASDREVRANLTDIDRGLCAKGISVRVDAGCFESGGSSVVECTYLAEVPNDTRAAIEADVGPFKLLEALVRWGFATARPILEVVVQDEYTHDVVVRYDERWVLVFDST